MICEEHKFLFIHIPKTAGTSIKNALPWCSSYFLHCPKHPKVRNYLFTHPQLFKFTFVRNPYDRMVSYYHFFKKKPKSFVQFVKTFHSRNKIEYKMLPYTKDDENNIAMDFVGRYETLQADFDIVCDILNLPKTKLEFLNATDHKHYREYYDDESYNIVSKLFAEDIKRFEYQF